MSHRKKINVLQLVEGFSLGGAEKKLMELVKCMDSNRFQTVVCSLGLGNEIEDEFKQLRKLGVKVVVIPRRRRIDLALITRIADLIRTNKIDIIMTTLFYADVLGALSGKITGVKAIFSWETTPSPDWLLKRRLWAYRFAVRFCKYVVAVSQSTARFLIERRGVPAEKVVVIPYGVDLRKYATGDSLKVRRELGLTKDNQVIGMIARFHPVKGHIYLINAAKEIVKEFPKVKFVFVGDGDLRSELEECVRTRNLDKNFVFLGYRSDIPDVIKAFDIFVLPSLYEGFPNVVLEAMASGKPVVATAVNGTEEAVVEGKTGFLVPPKDSNSLAEILLYLLKNPAKAKKLAQNGRKWAEEHFSLEKQVKSFEQLYENFYDRSTSTN